MFVTNGCIINWYVYSQKGGASDMMPHNYYTTPKAPRWIKTEAGQWAWLTNEEWRQLANRALSVSERQQLLAEAERMRLQSTSITDHN
jgi:hypothetical protein